MQDAHLAPATINATLAALRGVLRQAYLIHAITPDKYREICEVHGVRGSRVGSAGRAVELVEVEALLSACGRDESVAGARDACLIALLAGAGLRREEAVSLEVSDRARHLVFSCAFWQAR